MGKSPYKRRPVGSLEEAQQSLLDELGGAKDAAMLPGCTVSGGTLFKYTDTEDPDNRNRSMPVRLAAYFEQVAGVPLVSAWIAAQSGHVVVRLPDAGPIKLHDAVVRLGTECGHVFEEAGKAMEDGHVSHAEAHKLTIELRHVIEVCAGAIEHLKEIEE